MHIFILTDPRHPDRWELCRQELERQGITDYRVEFAVPHPGPPEAAINFSHKNLVALAKFYGLEEVCIMEDDVQFPAADGWEYFLKNKPKQYDLYLSATYGAMKGAVSAEPGALAYCCVVRPAGFHCYCIHKKYYDKFLSTPPDLHIDDAQIGGFFPVCYPFAAIQRADSWSANAKQKVNYNHNLKPRDVYGW